MTSIMGKNTKYLGEENSGKKQREQTPYKHIISSKPRMIRRSFIEIDLNCQREELRFSVLSYWRASGEI